MSDVIVPIKNYLLEHFLPGEPPANLTATTPLISGGILDPLGALQLVSFLESNFGIELEGHEVDADRLDTLERIGALVRSKLPTAAC